MSAASCVFLTQDKATGGVGVGERQAKTMQLPALAEYSRYISLTQCRYLELLYLPWQGHHLQVGVIKLKLVPQKNLGCSAKSESSGTHRSQKEIDGLKQRVYKVSSTCLLPVEPEKHDYLINKKFLVDLDAIQFM